MKRDFRKVISWSLYDWANSAFATSVMACFFPVFFREYWSVGSDVPTATFYLGAANSLASLIIAATAPVLGAVADSGSAKKKFLFFFAAMGIVMTGSLYFVAQGDWKLAVAIYVLSIIGFSGGNIFYDSLIVHVTSKQRMDFVSALGFSLGYLGGGLLFALNVATVLSPQTFGLSDANEAVRISFFLVAIWWGIFSLPVFFFVDEPKGINIGSRLHCISSGFKQLYATFLQIRRLRVVFLFLLGYWLYIDGVHTIIRMAIDYGMSLGFSSDSLIVALLITQFVGFPAALAFGKIGEKLGAKRGILIGIGVYLGITLWGSTLRQEYEFYILAVAVGTVQGGVQSLSRSLYAKIIPAAKAAEFFGFYNMIGKSAAIIGPFLMGWVSLVSGNPRYAILSISFLFVCGAAILFMVNEREGYRVANELERA